jgi:NAD(P)-dependent dehydrogenase (short-subunit alcohol dehydrogenase family)
MAGLDIDLSGKVALITGGSRGLGKAIALAMAERGAKIAICGRKQENLDKAADEFKKHGIDFFAKTAHAGKSDQLSMLFRGIEERFGKLDILVNNVGTNVLTPLVTEADESLWDKLMETNLKSAFLASALACKLMKKPELAKSSTSPPSQRGGPPEAWGFIVWPRLPWRC